MISVCPAICMEGIHCVSSNSDCFKIPEAATMWRLLTLSSFTHNNQTMVAAHSLQSSATHSCLTSRSPYLLQASQFLVGPRGNCTRVRCGLSCSFGKDICACAVYVRQAHSSCVQTDIVVGAAKQRASHRPPITTSCVADQRHLWLRLGEAMTSTCRLWPEKK